MAEQLPPVIQRLVDDGLLRSKAGEMPEPIARSMINMTWGRISDADKRFLARVGLASLINQNHHLVRVGRRGYPEKKETPKQRDAKAKAIKAAKTQVAKKMARALAEELDDFALNRLGRRLRTADGRQVRLADWTEADLTSYADQARSIACGYTQKADWCAMTLRFVRANDVKRVCDLPPIVRRRVANEAERAWQKEDDRAA